MTTAGEVIKNLESVAVDFAGDTIERQKRRHLEDADFEKIRETGFLLTGVPAEAGGLWKGIRESTRDYSAMVRTLAHGDPSIALVAAMHPAVMTFFLGVEEVADCQAEWQRQRDWLTEQARTNWWGTVTSEPGSGGDILKTRTRATGDQEAGYRITGDKHFGSGSGHADYMITTGVCTDGEAPQLFFLQYKSEPWDGSTGCRMTVEWDGMGMSATQSHAFRFEDFPATKTVSSEVLIRSAPITSQMSNMLFTAVVLGVADNALGFSASKIENRKDGLRAFEKMEWIRSQNELWLAQQAYEGALASIERGDEDAVAASIRAKICCAELIESSLARMAKVVGGASYSRAMPLAQWVEDVKALGFLRPPLPLAYDQLMPD